MRRSIQRQNEAAVLLSKHGLDVEQLAIRQARGQKNPDYRINGDLADSYAPQGNTSIRTIQDNIFDKVNEQGVSAVVLNLDDHSRNSVSAINRTLQVNPIPGLQAMHYVQNGTVHLARFY